MAEHSLKEMTLEITQECLNRCIYCSSVVGQRVPHLPLSVEVIRSLLSEAASLGLSSLSLSGGEPFLHPRISEILMACSSMKLDALKIYTSGVVRGDGGGVAPLNTRVIELVKQVGAIMVFNVQSIQDNVHDRLAGYRGRLRVTLASLRTAVSSGAAVECHIVPNRVNLDTLLSTTHELVDIGVKRISFLRLVRQGNAVDHWSVLALGREDIKRLEMILSSLHSEPQSSSKYRFGVPFGEISKSGQVCQAGVSKILVRWDGVCFPCEAFKECGDSSFAVGDVHVDPIGKVLCAVRRNACLHALKCLSRGRDVCPAQILYASG